MLSHLLIFILLFYAIGPSILPVTFHLNSSFSTEYVTKSASSSTDCMNALISKDDNFVIAGSLCSFINYTCLITIMKLDKQFNLLVQKYFPGNSKSDEFMGFILTTDNHFLLQIFSLNIFYIQRFFRDI